MENEITVATLIALRAERRTAGLNERNAFKAEQAAFKTLGHRQFTNEKIRVAVSAREAACAAHDVARAALKAARLAASPEVQAAFKATYEQEEV